TAFCDGKESVTASAPPKRITRTASVALFPAAVVTRATTGIDDVVDVDRSTSAAKLPLASSAAAAPLTCTCEPVTGANVPVTCSVLAADAMKVLSRGDAIVIDAAPLLVTSVVAVAVAPARLRPVAVMVVFAFGASATLAIANVPVVSLCDLIDGVAPFTEIVDGSTFTYVPLTSTLAAPVCVPAIGDVIAICGALPKYFTRTDVVAMRALLVFARALMMLMPFASVTPLTLHALLAGVNAMPLTSPDTTPSVTVPVTVILSLGDTAPLSGDVIVIVASL